MLTDAAETPRPCCIRETTPDKCFHPSEEGMPTLTGPVAIAAPLPSSLDAAAALKLQMMTAQTALTHTQHPAHCSYCSSCCQEIQNNADIILTAPKGEFKGFRAAALRHETLACCVRHALGRHGSHVVFFLYWKHMGFPFGFAIVN